MPVYMLDGFYLYISCKFQTLFLAPVLRYVYVSIAWMQGHDKALCMCVYVWVCAVVKLPVKVSREAPERRSGAPSKPKKAFQGPKMPIPLATCMLSQNVICVIRHAVSSCLVWNDFKIVLCTDVQIILWSQRHPATCRLLNWQTPAPRMYV